ncbi:MAG: primosomal protein N' [Proteobacteria bacterium]|nr:primosomal protein N' [Pseudomonadota bacterium]
MSPLFRVALDTPLRRLFDYTTPVAGGAAPQVGARVRVPFGRRTLVGIVLGTAEESAVPAERLKPILEILDPRPVLSPDVVELLAWASQYYQHPIGEVAMAALPRALRLGAAAARRSESWQATAEGREAAAVGEPRRAPRQQALLARIAQLGPCPAEVLDRDGEWRTAARALRARGWVEQRELDVAEAVAVSAAPNDPAPQLLAGQADAVERISASLGRYDAFVLQGITGSGKTEVYLHVIERVLRAGRRALVLVPEIGLTPQLVQRFHARLGVPPAVLHSGLTDAERLQAWRAAWQGTAAIVLGTRSAVFAPVPDLGLIVVDEEHDASFKQHEGGWHYSARDLAVLRAHHAGVPVVLGSATPSLETLHNAGTARYTHLRLTERAGAATPPQLKLIDLRSHAVRTGISTPAVLAISKHLAAGDQVLVYLNRRGYAPTLLCTACGWIAPCRECDARMTVHLAHQRLRCHHCGADSPLPAACPQCGYPVRPVGAGTERIEQTLQELFPQAPIARLDRDVVRRRDDMEEIMRRVAGGEARILVGTQMVTKGHDFPNVTLVVVLNADQGLFSSDFRASERLAQTIVQVAGRAGRGSRPGEVLIQTEFPDHPLLRQLLAEGYDGFAQVALEERAQAHWPPFSRLAALRDSARTPQAALLFLREARALAGEAADVRLLGPVPAAMARRAGRHHAQLLIESPDRTRLQAFLTEWLPQVEALKSARAVRWSLDVDPQELF